MKRLAFLAAAAALAAPVFAQSIVTVPDVIDYSPVMISPPIASSGLPHEGVIGVVSLPMSSVATIESSNTAVLGAGPSSMMVGSTAILDVPKYALSSPDFQKWIAWERSRVVSAP